MLAVHARVPPALLVAALIALGASPSGQRCPVALCRDPAPLYGQFDPRAPGCVVVFRRGLDAMAETQRLEERYGFTATWVWALEPGFSARFDAGVRDRLQCDPAVQYIVYDAVAWLRASEYACAEVERRAGRDGSACAVRR